ncbi:hypothetical protein Vretimale_2569 [Volvox reticuliferus]|nr:hypothetical protein Vretimale_2569 [Volvox reticuliferus]
MQDSTTQSPKAQTHQVAQQGQGPPCGVGQSYGGGRNVLTSVPAAELAQALHQLELCAAAGRAAVAAAEDDYGSHYVVHGLRGPHGHAVTGAGRAIAIPVLSPVASSYGSGEHYLHAEGMAEDDVEGSGGAGFFNIDDRNIEHEEDDSGVAADSAGTASGGEPGSQYPLKVRDCLCLANTIHRPFHAVAASPHPPFSTRPGGSNLDWKGARRPVTSSTSSSSSSSSQ